ncbi:DNA adenine methylase [Candidatus Desantisbacteria bacterium]|nr:DNA adenine methylase [Candidatus Desantisbacteria bacterium]
MNNNLVSYSSLFFNIPKENFPKCLVGKWKNSAVHSESTIHQISPYIGKMKSTMAHEIIATFTRENDVIYDPFCGSGTIAFEAWKLNRNIIANDLSIYAYVITHAKLFPYLSLKKAFDEINAAAKQAKMFIPSVDLRKIPQWVRLFFNSKTLRETIAWSQILLSKESYFILSSLLGILHHQRPGFLSYPSSHTVPYLREKKYPRNLYPELYQYRPVQERLEKKIERILKRVPELNPKLKRQCLMRNASDFIPNQKVNAIITSPPYMRQLDYGRDNRLRLWFLGEKNWKSLDNIISPHESDFLKLFKSCLKTWQNILLPNGLCILVVGDTYSRQYKMKLPDVIVRMATKEVGGYSMIYKYTELIPNDRRVRRGCNGSLTETILVFRKD